MHKFQPLRYKLHRAHLLLAHTSPNTPVCLVLACHDCDRVASAFCLRSSYTLPIVNTWPKHAAFSTNLRGRIRTGSDALVTHGIVSIPFVSYIRYRYPLIAGRSRCWLRNACTDLCYDLGWKIARTFRFHDALLNRQRGQLEIVIHNGMQDVSPNSINWNISAMWFGSKGI